jgi:UDP-N-acetylmuramoyl-tripeptide--D-alanyl-D-alanine ligase
MFQQLGYKGNEFRSWLARHLYTRVILPEHFLFVVVVFSLLVLLSERLTLTAATLILTTYVIFWFGSASRYRPDEDKKPLVFTPRMKRLAASLAAFLLFMIFLVVDLSLNGQFLNTRLVIRGTGLTLLDVEPYFLLFGLVVSDLSIPFLLLFASWLLRPVENQIQKGFKRKARRKLKGMPELKVIAITGSYGKTSTKVMIRDLLKERYRVCATPGSCNTPMGICKVINDQLDRHHQILVLEMGARYKGDIDELCDLATPDIAVITNVGTAHLETFGSPEAIAREKSTLARRLKPGGLLILNGDDPVVTEMDQWCEEATVIRAGLAEGDLRATDVTYDRNGTSFKLQIAHPDGTLSEQQISFRLLGVHNVMNFLLAASVADRMGIRSATMSLAAREFEPVEHRLELKERGGVTVIDDAFNSPRLITVAVF